jgi:hypothetical protein
VAVGGTGVAPAGLPVDHDLRDARALAVAAVGLHLGFEVAHVTRSDVGSVEIRANLAAVRAADDEAGVGVVVVLGDPLAVLEDGNVSLDVAACRHVELLVRVDVIVLRALGAAGLLGQDRRDADQLDNLLDLGSGKPGVVGRGLERIDALDLPGLGSLDDLLDARVAGIDTGDVVRLGRLRRHDLGGRLAVVVAATGRAEKRDTDNGGQDQECEPLHLVLLGLTRETSLSLIPLRRHGRLY